MFKCVKLKGFTKSKKQRHFFFFILYVVVLLRNGLGIYTCIFLFNYLIITLLVISGQFVHSEGSNFCRCFSGLCSCACG